jgi:thiol:disulfide interchange protein DsbC
MMRMRIALGPIGLLALCCGAGAAFTAYAETKTATNVAGIPVPADVRARVVAKLPGAKAEDVVASPVPGLYEVTVGGMIVYVSSDGRYLVSGSMYDVESQTNLTASRRNAARSQALAAAKPADMIVFSPPNPKATVTVFTDIDCGFCRKFHTQIADINKAGIEVRYMMFPRSGPGTESWRKAEAVWCSKDRKDALTRAKAGEQLKVQSCKAPSVQTQYELGENLGIEGTPAIFTEQGEYIGGFMTPAQLLQAATATPGKTASAAP